MDVRTKEEGYFMPIEKTPMTKPLYFSRLKQPRPHQAYSPARADLDNHQDTLHYIPKTMRLTAELIKGSLSYNNPLGERELDLRGTMHPKRTDTST